MNNDQYYLYSLILEKYIEDLELDLQVEQLRNMYPKNPWQVPVNPKDLYSTKKCPTCGIDLSAVMCYTCSNPRCPTGMGPVMSIS